MKQGIQRNQYDHHKGDISGRPECLHEIVQPWEVGWNPCLGWDTRKKWTCDACKKDLTKERWKREKERFDAVRAEDKARSVEEHAVLLHGLAIRLDVLLLFTFVHNCWDWPTWRVVRDIVKPTTAATRCRYGDLPVMQGKPWFGPADVFMSHCWGAKFGDLVGAACYGGRMQRYVWIDIFAVRQSPGNLADLDFRSVVQRSKALIVAVAKVDELTTFKKRKGEHAAFLKSSAGKEAQRIIAFCRLWCIVEVAAAIEMSVAVVITGGVVRRESEQRWSFDTTGMKE